MGRQVHWHSTLVVLLLLACMVTIAYAEPTKVTFMFRGGTLQAQLVNVWKAEFEKKNPDITIEWQEAVGDWIQKLPVWVATGVGPDVFEMWGGDARNWGDTGVLLDLNPFVKRDFTTNDIKDYFPVSWDATELTFGPNKGMRYGLPSNGNVFLLYYNKEMFAQAGVPFLNVLDQQGNWTWDSFITVGKKLTRTDGAKITQWAFDSDDLYYPTGRGAGWIHAAGGQYFNLPHNPTEFTGDKPETVKAFTYLQDLIWKYQIMSPIATRGQASFKSQKAAINVWLGTASLADCDKNLTFDWDLGPRPMGPKSRGYYLASDMFGVSSQTKNKEASWRFIKYLTSTEGQVAYARVMGRGPTRRSVLPEYQSLFPKRSTIYTMYGMMDAVLSPATFMTLEANNLINKTVREQIATNAKSAQQAMSEIADAMRAVQK